MKLSRILFGAVVASLPALLCGQMLDPSLLLKPPTNAWPTYNGDYTGRRFSPLSQINQSTIKTLNLAWVHRVMPGEVPGSIVGGLGPAARGGGSSEFGGPQIKSTPLMVNGILYFTTPDNTWAVDARSGRELWHYFWRTTGGIHIGNRGVGMYGNWLFFETPDNYLVSLDAKTGKERWHVQIADVKQEYFSTPAPVIVGNHVIVGTGGDSLDVPGFLEAHDPETGAIQWKWWSEPLKKGDPGSETWPDEYSMRHGGGMTWIPGTYDPELHLYYIGTGNPNPVMAGQSRKGDDLFTCTIVALNVDTGKLVWHFQTSPHDTHDWDSVQTPVLIDGEIDGKPRKLLAQASRNGYFFLLDRTNGKNIVARPYIETLNWSKGVDSEGHPIPNPEKEPQVSGVLVSPPSGGATNWPSPSFDPETGLFYVSTSEAFSEFYLTDTDPHPEGYGAAERASGRLGSTLRAIDYKTGKTCWRHDYPGGGGISGLLTTAGKLLFSGDGSQHLVAFDPANGKILWHAGLAGNISNGPETYMLDGKQYLVVGAGDSLYAFTLAE
ncbi:MAG TPA: acido-empty-quinoprotein group A [Bryobacteraceae bacterium]|jgi:alcohol dehydrogenase (cytochrome c)|nr:acido-empty-quinoprotein group A [Bryobacteraceae bacterium]